MLDLKRQKMFYLCIIDVVSYSRLELGLSKTQDTRVLRDPYIRPRSRLGRGFVFKE
jgi:hypothetical protein